MTDNSKAIRDLLETLINIDDRIDRFGDTSYHLAEVARYGDLADPSGPHYDTRE